MGGITREQVDSMDCDAFVHTFGNVVEHTPLCAAAVWAMQPFGSLRRLHEAICIFLDELLAIGQEGVLRLHPDLAGSMAEQGLLTGESTKEQARLEFTLDESETLQGMNERYKLKFGFPFVICARENKKQAILSGIKARFENDKQTELATGIEEVKKIAFYRLLDIVQHSEEESML